MTHEELLAEIDFEIKYCTCEGWGNNCYQEENIPWVALRAVVELHNGSDLHNRCIACEYGNNCETIQAIKKELK